jgi:TrmH family RNA methyltransferase
MITSTNNPRLKHVRALTKKARTRFTEHQFILEGMRLIEEALQASAVPDFVLYDPASAETSHRLQRLLAQLEEIGTECLAIEAKLFGRLSDTQTPQGILAVCPWPALPAPESPTFVLVLDGIADPGNLGTAMRTATAAGVDLIILPPNTVDPFNPKVVRSAMGAHFQIALQQQTWDIIARNMPPLFVAEARAQHTIYQIDWRPPLTLVIGSEAHGPSTNAISHAHELIRIPMERGESLNAAMAAGIILYEVYRQRHHSSHHLNKNSSY